METEKIVSTAVKMKKIIDKVIREEYGGSDPRIDPCVLKARVDYKFHIIEVFVVGKWRPLRYYMGKGIPSKKIQEEVISRVRMNAGDIFKGKVELDFGDHHV